MVSLLDFGGNFVISIYASVIIKNSGVTVRPELQALSLPAIMIIGSLVSTVTVEKYGRKVIFTSLLNGSNSEGKFKLFTVKSLFTLFVENTK